MYSSSQKSGSVNQSEALSKKKKKGADKPSITASIHDAG